MNPEILVPISFFVLVAFLIKSLMTYRQNKHTRLHQTLQMAMQNQHPLDGDTLSRLATAIDPKRSDLRKAILFFILALVFISFALLLPFGDSQGKLAMLAIASIPAVFALTFILFWKFWYR